MLTDQLRGTGENLGRLLQGIGEALLHPEQWVEIAGLSDQVPMMFWLETVEIICRGDLQLPNMLVRCSDGRLFIAWNAKKTPLLFTLPERGA